jgi:hypothetical protein
MNMLLSASSLMKYFLHMFFFRNLFVAAIFLVGTSDLKQISRPRLRRGMTLREGLFWRGRH